MEYIQEWCLVKISSRFKREPRGKERPDPGFGCAPGSDTRQRGYWFLTIRERLINIIFCLQGFIVSASYPA